MFFTETRCEIAWPRGIKFRVKYQFQATKDRGIFHAFFSYRYSFIKILLAARP